MDLLCSFTDLLLETCPAAAETKNAQPTSGSVRVIRRHGVRYLVIGGVAAVIHGVPRATFDLDMLVEASRGNAERLLQALIEAGFGTATLTNVEDLLSHEITVLLDRVRIDVQTSTPGLVFQDAWERRVTIQYQGQAFQVVSLQDLIASKKASGRPVDLEDVRLLSLRAEEGH